MTQVARENLRTAIFGGTFDPVHNAHLEIARAAADRFGLERILFVPAANPPHKAGHTIASFEDRVQMLELACAADGRFEVSRIEEGTGKSYSILTIERLARAGFGPLWFLIGADAFAEIRTWHRWQDVIAAVEFIVVPREGSVWQPPEGAIVHELTGIESPVSSSEVRDRIASLSEGPATADIPVPEPVLEWIRDHDLYVRKRPKIPVKTA